MEFPESLEDHIKYMDSVGIQTAVMTPSIKSEWSLSLAPEGTNRVSATLQMVSDGRQNTKTCVDAA